MDSAFLRELLKRKSEAKLSDLLRLLENGETARAQVALGGFRVCRELLKDIQFHAEAAERISLEEAQRIERKRMRRLAKSA